MDADKNGKISRREFLAGIEKQCMADEEILSKIIDSSDRVWLEQITDKTFKEADRDRSGHVDLDEAVTYFTKVSEHFGKQPYTRAQVEELTQAADKNKDGRMSKPELRRVVIRFVVKMALSLSSTDASSPSSGG